MPQLKPVEDIIKLIPEQRDQLRIAKDYREQLLPRVVHEVIKSEPPVRAQACHSWG